MKHEQQRIALAEWAGSGCPECVVGSSAQWVKTYGKEHLGANRATGHCRNCRHRFHAEDSYFPDEGDYCAAFSVDDIQFCPAWREYCQNASDAANREEHAMNTPKTATIDSLHPICSAQVVLANLASYVLKLEEAPCSAQSHFDHAVFVLSEMCADWKPSDDDVVKVIQDAREHMAHYFEKAKSPWPNTEVSHK